MVYFSSFFFIVGMDDILNADKYLRSLSFSHTVLRMGCIAATELSYLSCTMLLAILRFAFSIERSSHSFLSFVFSCDSLFLMLIGAAYLLEPTLFVFSLSLSLLLVLVPVNGFFDYRFICLSITEV